MIDQASIQAEERERTGSAGARRLRREGFIPAVVYGHGQEARNLKVEEGMLRRLLEGISVDNTLVNLRVGDEEENKVLIREVQRHPWKPRLLHVDFFQIREDEEIRVGVPIRYVGTPQGVSEDGGILQTNLNQIEIECLPTEIPEYFEANVEELEIGDSLHVSDLEMGGVRALEDMERTICVVVPPTIITVEEEEEEELELEEMEPELIGEEAEEELEVPEGEEGPDAAPEVGEEEEYEI